MKRWYKILRIVIPIVLLTIIISKIDFEILGEVYVRSNKSLLILAFLSYPIRYLLFTVRWKLVLNMFGKHDISFLHLLKTIYIGFFVGFFIPASVGIDIYRVVSLRKTNSTHVNIGLIFQEKLMGLVVCGFFVLFFSSFLNVDLGKIYPYVRNILYAIIFVSLFILTVLFLFKTNLHIQKILSFTEGKLIKLLGWFTLKFKKEIKLEEGFLNKVLKVSLFPKMIMVVLLFSICNQGIGAVFANIAFQALESDIPLVYNLFASPLLNIILLFPISFGGFGIREGSYILIFGILGVAAEISFMVSFIFMVSTFINVGIGGIIYILDKKTLNG
ncbi:MAG: flippase-like domain-containing protein [Bacteroidetes bacterium]|nr:flippase-like domain-containing protein [Bacteroidota bacterium]